MLYERADFAGGGGLPPWRRHGRFFAEDNTDRVMLPTVAGAAPPADFVEVVAADATSLADAAILFPADPAGVVTIGVAPPPDAGDIKSLQLVSDLTDAGILFPADPAGVVTVGVAPLADVRPVTMAVADLTDAGILFSADPAGVVTVGVAPRLFLPDCVCDMIQDPGSPRRSSEAC